ncbi:glycosyl hydrolases family 38 N-terminal domain-containing protein [Mycena metata]|uniref:Glycosyl hydrolases family 38 N-terminal domain-containing protein n=1 Tax=Mycena metata TaxID=1033252 RepID=A0AAD7NFJ1_9AGAR|nr:glycosyl hydrolases family 38 N-terminal domain-containing protein [Mycena metata]
MDLATPILAAALPLATTMMVCPTTHNDWDWQQTFAGYYTCAFNEFGVRGILDNVVAILESNNTDFRFSYAEVGFLREYLTEYPAKAPAFNNMEQFSLLGGGITSPDNQVTHSEVFIRNYLTGREYLDSVNLTHTIFPVAWLPDDFGHSPQLPVLIEALGMKAIGLSRVPGSPQPTPCNATQTTAANICGNGTTFRWSGRDNSSVLTHFMPDTYAGITGFEPMDAHAGMTEFLSDYGDCVWPGGTVFAPQGGDWQFPDGDPVPLGYNWTGVPGPLNSSVTGQLATFAEYYDTLMKPSTVIGNFTLFAENYWTGYFASRPQLKINHYEAAQLLLGAEVLGSILTVYNGTTPDMQASLNNKIAAGWDLLVPSTHHDFVAGTAPDSVYDCGTNCGTCNISNPFPGDVLDSKGQLYMSNQTVALARDAMSAALGQLSATIQWTTQQNIVPVVVFNQLGLDLPNTAMVEMDDPTGGKVAYEVIVDGTASPVQRSWNGQIAVPIPPSPPQPINNSTFIFGNGAVSLTLVQAFGWAIENLTIGNKSYVQLGAPANHIGVWQDDGNLYQFGMEYVDGDCGTGTFALHSSLTASGSATLLENGPVRWRFNATLSDTFGNLYSTQYDLVRGETLVRINTTGAAPHQLGGGSSVLASFPMRTAEGATAFAMEYGTAYFWEDREPQKSWNGLTFRASHDFAQLITTQGGSAVAAVYHNGIPAWTINATTSTLHGVLLRNTPATGRGAFGTDNGTHSQYYTLDVLPQLAETGYPLRTSLYAHTPLRTLPLNLTQPVLKLPQEAQLASITPLDSVLAVGKTKNNKLVLRIQRSNPADEDVNIELPWRFNQPIPPPPNPSIVSALETPIDSAPPVETSRSSTSFLANRVLMTLEVPL